MNGGTDPPFKFELVAPPKDLQDRVNTYFLLHTQPGRIDEIMPAYSGQIFVYLSGSGAMHFQGGTQEGPGSVFFNAPLLRATEFSLEGPVCCVGASLTQLGWASMVGLPVHKANHRVFSPSEIFENKIADQFLALSSGDPNDLNAVVENLSDAIRAASSPLSSTHADMIAATVAWLSSAFSPPVEDLYERVPMSRRQVQRLCNRFFGVPPMQLVKRFRALRAASLLGMPNIPETVRNEISLAFFDQSHLINDIRRYAGRTPKLLAEGSLVFETFDPEAHGPTGKIVRDALKSTR